MTDQEYTKSTYQSFIDGVEIDPPKDDAPPEILLSPVTNETIRYVHYATAFQIDTAIEHAYKAYIGTCDSSTSPQGFHSNDRATIQSNGWGHASQIQNRITILRSISKLLAQNVRKLADLEVCQIGRPAKEMRFQLSRLPEWFDYYASLLHTHESDAVKPFGPGYLNYTKRVPLGVVAQVIPWNHPLLIAVKKIAPALAAGNTIILKPSELAPCSLIEFAKLCSQAGLPKGVLQVLLGNGQMCAQRIVSHPLVTKMDFTGGPRTGRLMGESAGRNLCAYAAELGGKAPMIVFAPPNNNGKDIDTELDKYLDPIVNGCAFGAFIASGQTCIAGTRVICEASIYNIFQQKLVKKLNSFHLGDPMKLETSIGPVISKKQLEFIDSTVKKALEDPRLELLCGGGIKDDFEGELSPLNKGNYYQPTLIAVRSASNESEKDIASTTHHENILFQTELFGPVLGLCPFDNQDEAIGLANDTPFGLGCSIWTNDISQAHTVADQVQSGIIWINDHHKNNPSSPWGGLTKESGIGRENGIEAFLAYSQTKSIVVNCGRYTSDWFQDPNARYN